MWFIIFWFFELLKFSLFHNTQSAFVTVPFIFNKFSFSFALFLSPSCNSISVNIHICPQHRNHHTFWNTYIKATNCTIQIINILFFFFWQFLSVHCWKMYDESVSLSFCLFFLLTYQFWHMFQNVIRCIKASCLYIFLVNFFYESE